MISLELHEAQLFRILTSFFGEENVIHNMSLMSVCGGQLPDTMATRHTQGISEDVEAWARKSKCLFTVVDDDDLPKVVFDFFSGFDRPFDVKEVEFQRNVGPILQLKGIRYLTISIDEFNEILDPEGDMDFYHWLKDKWSGEPLV